MPSYYNEIDPYAAQWLRNLIAAGHIAPGDVDTRSIEDVKPDDLRPYKQCHFFAGIGVWSLALRRIGWPDDRRIWTGSCPCQPFSAAGQGAAFADERHLWPAFFHLITQCTPPIVVGEQVASKDADPWIDLVQADMEALGYAFGAVAFPSAGVGAPHIRDRTYWGGSRVVADSHDARSQGRSGVLERSAECAAGARGVALGLADTQCLTGRCEAKSADHDGPQADRSANRPCGCGSALGGLADDDCFGLGAAACQQLQDTEHYAEPCGVLSQGQPAAGPTNGLWRAADWLFCRDGKWRPVEPGSSPLAHAWAGGNRVGMLRAAGNAINVEAASAFLDAFVNNP